MLKSISVWAYAPDRPLREVFEMAAAQGFAGVEVAIADKGEITPQTSRADLQSIVETARDYGITLASLASGLGWSNPILSSDEEIWERSIQIVRDSLRVARDLGLDAILVVPGRVTEAVSYQTAFDQTLKALRELALYAQEMGVSIGIENVWNKFLLSPLEIRDLIDAVGSPRVGCYFDVGNVLVNGYPQQWIEILAHRIVRVHFKDFQTEVGTLDGFCPLLEGDVDFAAVMQSLKAVGYDGPVTSEFFNCEDDLPAISQAMNVIAAMGN